MASRFTRQLFSSSIRSRVIWQSFKAGAGRRGMSSAAAETKKGSDLPWLIGSAAVFGPAFVYLTLPSSRKTAPHKPHDAKHSQSHAPLPMKDDEGTVADVSGSIAKAEEDDVPQADAASAKTHEDEPKDEKEEASKEEKEEGSVSLEEKKEAESAEKKPNTGEKGSEYEKPPGASPDAAAKLQGGKTDSDKVGADKGNKEKKEEEKENSE